MAETGFLTRLMQSLEQRGLLSRTVEFLPDDAALTERTRRGQFLTRPELAVLLAYAKLTLYDDLLATSVPDDPILPANCPSIFRAKFRTNSRQRSNSIACGGRSSQLASPMVINRGGPACVVRLIDETDADIKTIVMAYVAVDECYGLRWLNDAIDALDTCIDGQVQLSLYASAGPLLSRMVWYVRNVDFKDGWRPRACPDIRQIVAGLDTACQDLQADAASVGRT